MDQTSCSSLSTLRWALELSKNSWVLAIRFADRESDLPTRFEGWRIPLATWKITTGRGVMAGGPGGAYLSKDGLHWTEVKLWREDETGAADYLHAYWMGRYYHFVPR